MQTKTHSILKSTLAWLAIATLLLTGLVGPVRADGELDTSFGTNGFAYTDVSTAASDKAYGVAIQTDGKIVVVGASDNGTDDDLAVVRYLSTGILDADFGTGGKLTTPVGSGDDVAYGVAIQSDGKVVVAGSSFDGAANSLVLARYTVTGTLDTTFGAAGVVTTTISGGDDVAKAVAIQTDGKIVVTGSADGDFCLVRYDDDGNLDTGTFGGGDGIVTTDFFGATDRAHSIGIQEDDGKLVVAGHIDIGSSDEFAVARYLTNGELDNTFGGTGKVTTDFGGNSVDQAFSVAIQPDGKIVLAGFVNTGGPGSTDDFALARYNTNGILDSTFSSDGRVITPVGANDDQAYSVAVQPTGKIVVAGFSDNKTPTNQDYTLARYTITGTLDTTFGVTGVVTTDLGTINTVNTSADQAYAAAIQADNNIVVVGYTDHPAGNDNFGVVRYESPNSAPTVVDVDKVGLEDGDIGFTTADFADSFDDADGDGLVRVKVASLPSNGTLALSDSPLVQDQEIPAGELGDLAFAPDGDWSGVTSFGWNGFDGLDYAAVGALVNITITGVNDAPSFAGGADEIVLEDGGPQSVVGWATDMSAGPADEAGQILTFTLSTSDDTLFASLPAVETTTGNLSYTPAADLSGSATVTVTLADDGGTANGGVDSSPSQVFTITVTPVNDAPSFTKGADTTVLEDAGPQSLAGWATGISAGPADEAGQALTFTVTTDNDALFGVPPSVDSATGDMNYTPGADLNGRAIVTVTLMDDGGTTNGGVDGSPAQAFTITVTPVNDAPTISDIADRTISVNRSTGPITFTVGDVETAAGSLIVSSGSSNRTLVLSGTVSFGGEGITRTVTVTPPLHQTGTATITVTVTDGELSAHDTFVLTVEGHVVYMPLALRAYTE